MRPRLVILRPQPGGVATARLADAAGFDPVLMPLFTVNSVPWRLPQRADFDALLITSANAVRYAGPQLEQLRSLPVYAVGKQTAQLANEAGLSVVRIGSGGINAIIPALIGDGRQQVLRLAGRDNIPVDPDGLTLVTRIVYEAQALPLSTAQIAGLCDNIIIALHSARAAQHWASQCDAAQLDRDRFAIAAFAPSIAAAAGSGWKAMAIAKQPDDLALLSAAKTLVTVAPGCSFPKKAKERE